MFCTLARYPMVVLLSLVSILGTGCSPSRHTSVGRYEKLPEGAYAIVAEIRAKPGKEDALRATTLPLVSQVRSEPNNLLYFLHEDRTSPGRFIFYEIFVSQKDFEAHNASAHVQEWFAQIPALAEGSVEVVHMKILGN